jgi:tetratricopeptide (TPR) repeat protein
LLNCNFENAFLVRAGVKKKTEDYKGSIEDFDKVISINPYNDHASYLRGMTKLSMENIDGCMEDLEYTIKINPKNMDAYYFKGWIETAGPNKEAGYADLKKAADLGSTEALALLKKLLR